MITPSFLEENDQPTVIGHVFEAPLVIKGWTGLPLLELGSWGIFAWLAGSKHPEWSASRRAAVGAMSTAILFVSEWCHNLAHAWAASKISKPVDAIRIFFGTPLLIYYDINDQQVLSGEHMLRAAGGPIFNSILVLLTSVASQLTRKGSTAHYYANFALSANLFLFISSLMPIPFLDGGVLLKWLRVRQGRTITYADRDVRKVNLALGSGMAVASAVFMKKHRHWLAAAAAAFSATALAVGLGLLREKNKPFIK